MKFGIKHILYIIFFTNTTIISASSFSDTLLLNGLYSGIIELNRINTNPNIILNIKNDTVTVIINPNFDTPFYPSLQMKNINFTDTSFSFIGHFSQREGKIQKEIIIKKGEIKENGNILTGIFEEKTILFNQSVITLKGIVTFNRINNIAPTPKMDENEDGAISLRELKIRGINKDKLEFLQMYKALEEFNIGLSKSNSRVSFEVMSKAYQLYKKQN